MEDPPGSPGSPNIKAEPQENPDGAPPFNTGEIINLISDDEDEPAAPTNARFLGSPFQEPQKESEAVNLGPSLLLTKPNPAKPNEKDALKAKREKLQAMVAAKRSESTAKRRNAAQSAQSAPPAPPTQPAQPPQRTQRTPLVGRSDLFVTESNPGTPDPAEIFRLFQREIEEKRRDGTLTWQEEIQFERAKDAEQARITKERLDNAFDGSDDAVSAEEDPRMSPSVASLPEDDDGVPEKRGRKRKADSATSKSQPKKRRAAPKSAEDILVTARRKIEAKTKAKAAGRAKKQAPKKGCKPKPTAPDLLNTAGMLGNNVFEDAARMRDVPDQPTFGSDHDKRKDKALRSLIASVPEEYRPIAKTDKKYLEDAMKDFTGRGAVTPAEDGNWNVKGMCVTLKHYQVLGVAFMRRRECSSIAPKGGILADSMGLGKTITMLTNIVNGKSLQKSKCRTTLIVASAALVSQWRREITEKVFTDKENPHGIGRVKVYDAKLKSNQEIEELMECDIVLTTYTQVQKSYPKAEIPAEYTTAEQKNEWWKRHWETHRGLLHQIAWFRIVLDESQAIKNHKSLTARACIALSAKHHWAISGTPLQNGIEEFYSIFKFIREPHASQSMRLFRKNFCSSDDGMQKLDVFLRKLMIRRTHLDTLFNARLLDLPQPKETVIMLDFNEIERNIYEIVKSRFIKRINCISKAGDLDKQYGHIWTMLLRLRQLTSHILLVQGTITDLLEREDFERLHKIASDDLSEESEALLTHLREKLKENGGTPRVDGREGATVVTETESIPNHRTGFDAGLHDVGGKHGLTYKFDRYLESLLNSESWDAIASRALCCGCRQPPLDPMVTSCFHVYCHSCLQDLQQSFARRAMERHRCTECGQYYNDAKKCQRSLEKFSGAYDNLTGSIEGEGLSLAGQNQGRKAKLQSWIHMRGDVLPSTKTIAAKSQILNWIEEDPSVKIIVYSQWIPMLHVLGRICQTEGWTFEKYTGHMSHESRDNAIKSFGDPTRGKRILLASLKCGGLGLNLTMASKVLLLDPWWNSAVEQQAFCRVFRIGQQKETQMARLIVKGTIDQAIYCLQGMKSQVIDRAMDDSTREERLSIHQLMRLFGRVEETEDGVPFIFAHEDDGNDADDDSSHFTPPPRAADHASDEEGDGIDDDV